MTGEQLVAVLAIPAALAARFWWKSFWVGHHTRARDAHDAKAWRHMRGGK